ncbi:hypothetical protein pb186bvf_008291 [Paramecium bursaria]
MQLYYYKIQIKSNNNKLRTSYRNLGIFNYSLQFRILQTSIKLYLPDFINKNLLNPQQYWRPYFKQLEALIQPTDAQIQIFNYVLFIKYEIMNENKNNLIKIYPQYIQIENV